MCRALKNRLLRYFVYFRRAHSTYFAYALSFTNFLVITYTLLLHQVFGLPLDPLHFALWIVLFLPTYAVVCVLVGWIDYRKGLFKVETTVAAAHNPWIQDLLRAIYLLADGRNEEVKKVLEKWVRGIGKCRERGGLGAS